MVLFKSKTAFIKARKAVTSDTQLAAAFGVSPQSIGRIKAKLGVTAADFPKKKVAVKKAVKHVAAAKVVAKPAVTPVSVKAVKPVAKKAVAAKKVVAKKVVAKKTSKK